MFFIRLFLANAPEKIGGRRARLREQHNLFRYQGKSLTFCTCTRSCERANDVGMSNAILRNYLKGTQSAGAQAR